jgi:antitoxin component YwqK of YwqJK toxin-antitoxin module
MSGKYVIVFFSCLIIGSGCQSVEKKKTVLTIDKANLMLKDGMTLVDSKPFSGTLVGLFPNQKDTLFIRNYLNGKENGEWKQFYPNQILEEVRYYKNGKKQGRYLAFWENGAKKIDYFFENDEYEGLCQEWTSSGRLIKAMNYRKGHEEGSQKVWNEDGKIRSNYLIIKGRRYGLLGTKNCKNVSEKVFGK